MKRFERKINAQAILEQREPSIDPIAEKVHRHYVVTGGELAIRDRGHKNWGHTINHNFELRSNLNTSNYVELLNGESFSVKSEYGHTVLRAPEGVNPEFTISFSKPQGVPSEQHTSNGKFRYRNWSVILEVYYPSDKTQLKPDSSFVIPRTPWETKAETEKFDLPFEDPNFDEKSHYHSSRYNPFWFNSEDGATAPILRLADSGKTDIFLITYNERAGKAVIMPLAAGVTGLPDPQVPQPGTTQPNPVDTAGGGNPWDPTGGGNDEDSETTGFPSDLTPTAPGTPTDFTYDKPVEKPTEGNSTIYALHEDGFSYSPNGGKEWVHRKLRTMGQLKDMVVNSQYGIWILNQAGDVFYAQNRSASFSKIDFSSLYESGDLVIDVPNGKFESGDLAPWVANSGDTPRIVETTTPPQLPGSTKYLTRDWRIINPQDYELTQSITPPAGFNDLVLRASCFTQNGAKGVLRVDYQKKMAVPNGTRTFTGNRILNFATAPNGAQLDLVFVSGSQAGIDFGNGESGTRVMNLVYAGTNNNYESEWFISLSDLDSFEWIEVLESDVIVYDPQNDIVTTNIGGGQIRIETKNNQDNINTAGLIFTKPQVSVYIRLSASSLDISIDLTNNQQYPAGITRFSETQEQGAWEVLEVDISDISENNIDIYIEGFGSGGGAADVWFDNVEIVAKGGAQIPGATEILHTQRGADLFIEEAVYEDNPFNPALSETGMMNVQRAQGSGLFRLIFDGVNMKARASSSEDYIDVLAGETIEAFSGGSVPVVATQSGSLHIFDRDNATTSISWALTDTNVYLSQDDLKSGALMTNKGNGQTYIVDAAGIATWSVQPANTSAADRRSVATGTGRYFGWNVGNKDFYWSDQPETEWKLGGALYKPIIKMVESR